MFQQRQGFEHDPPSGRALVGEGIECDARYGGIFVVIEGIAGDFVHEGGGRAPVFVGEGFVDAGFDVGFGFGLVDAVVCVSVCV